MGREGPKMHNACFHLASTLAFCLYLSIGVAPSRKGLIADSPKF
jgi:hypothetical protein